MEDRRIVQGDVFWVDVGDPDDSSPGYPRPIVVVQNNLFNRSGIRTVVTCALTSNLRRAGDPGNVLLVPGDAGLPEQSVVNVFQVLTVDKCRLGDRIGSLRRKGPGSSLRYRTPAGAERYAGVSRATASRTSAGRL